MYVKLRFATQPTINNTLARSTAPLGKMSDSASPSRRHDDDSTSFPTASSLEVVAPRPTRSEYAAYAAIIRDLEAQSRAGFAWRLARSDEGDSACPSADGQVRSKSERRKNLLSEDGLSTAWPLAPADLPPPVELMEEAILTFAASYIRSQHITLRDTPHSVKRDEDMDLPPGLVPSTMEFINGTLVGMAGMRPVDVAKKRKAMSRLRWGSVIDAASMTCGDHQCVRLDGSPWTDCGAESFCERMKG